MAPGKRGQIMKELRIGVVLYGGVSLAIYMNGITTELWHAIRASRLPPDKLTGTEKLYRALLDEVARESGTQIAIVVDTIAGTSAGGVNGAVLGHAIANGSDAAVLNRVWVEDAGIEKLRREPKERAPLWVRAGMWAGETVKFLGLKDHLAKIGKVVELRWLRDSLCAVVRSKDGRDTPLSGGYFARMIASTLGDMRQAGGGPALLGPHNVLDLYLTQTDLYGWPRRLAVSDRYHAKPLFERTHAHCLQFRMVGKRSDFTDEFALTYAARTTAGFPVAFAAANTVDLAAEFTQGQPGANAPDLAAFARRHLNEHVMNNFDPAHAWMADGGFLDNRPFSYVADAIEGKAAEHEVTRAVIYVEPDPELSVTPPPATSPGLLALAGKIYGLFRHEPIVADLMRLSDRNARVRRIKEMLAAETGRVDAVVQDLGRNLPPPGNDLPTLSDFSGWIDEVNGHLASREQAGYAGYMQLKARRAAETLAEVICRALGFRWETQHAWLVRETVRWMMEAQYAMDAPQFVDGAYRLNAPQLTLLEAFDFPYRLRRLRHIVRTVNALYAELGTHQELKQAPERAAALRPILDRIKGALADAAAAYEEKLRDDAQVRNLVLEMLGGDAQTIERNMAALEFDASQALSRFGQALSALQDRLFPMFTALAQAENRALEGVLKAAAAQLQAAGAPASFDAALAKACVGFALIDVAIFPMMDMAGLQDLIEIDALRISPSDGDIVANRQKLKSSAMGAFAGFLDRGAREYDLALGRLDGAERLVDLVLMAGFGELKREEEAQRRALRDGLRAKYRAALATQIVAAQAASASPAIRAELLALTFNP